jgi:hypothetical protein
VPGDLSGESGWVSRGLVTAPRNVQIGSDEQQTCAALAADHGYLR